MKKILLIILLVGCNEPKVKNVETIQPKPKPKPHIVEYVLPAIIELESGGDSLAKGSSNDLGILQITPICVKDYNIHSGDSLNHSDMIHPKLALRVYFYQMHRLYIAYCKKYGHEPTEAQVVSFWNGSRYNQKYVEKYLKIKSRD